MYVIRGIEEIYESGIDKKQKVLEIFQDIVIIQRFIGFVQCKIMRFNCGNMFRLIIMIYRLFLEGKEEKRIQKR